LQSAAASIGIEVRRHPGVTVVTPGDLRPAGGREYKVFTPYYRRWQSTRWRTVEGAPHRIPVPHDRQPPEHLELATLDALLPELTGGGRSKQVIAGGESRARLRLGAFQADGIARYAERRDLLAEDATSRLSAALHFGCLSPTEVAVRLAAVPGGEAFVRQLCWRDFFHQILAARPDAAHEDYRASDRRWSDASDSPDALEAWCRGRTGFPLVDAAMRQLETEGFVHNRARMVVASFLCKDLHLDWRLGAAHFMSLLVDGDLANNQLNWQWVAGSGSDTNPNRIFNPVTQGRRYDPDGAYIRRYLPELAELDAHSVHWPDAATRRRVGYPAPIVDHRQAIATYRALRH
jgi:deoxyribodipyrimidine photo-lyase